MEMEINIIGFGADYARLLDSVDGGLFLTQLVYWHKKMEGQWFYKTGKDWEQTTWIKRHRREVICQQLIEMGILKTKRGGMYGRTYYSVDFEQLSQCMQGIAKALPTKQPESERLTMENEAENRQHDEQYDADCQQSTVLMDENGDHPSVNAFVDSQQTSLQSNDIHPDQSTNTFADSQQTATEIHEKNDDESANTFVDSQQTPLQTSNIHSDKSANTFADYQQTPSQTISKHLCGQSTNAFADSQHTITKNTTKINTKNTTKDTTKTFVEVENPTASQRNSQQNLSEQFSATEKPSQQTPASGSSSPATRRGGDEPESLNQQNQRDAATHHRATEGDGQPTESAGSSRCRARMGDDNTPDGNLSRQGEELATPRDTSVAEEHLSKLRKMLGMPSSKNTSTPAEPPGAKPKPAASSPVSHSPTGAQSMSSLLAQVAQTLEPPEDWVAEDEVATEPETPKPLPDVKQVTEDKSTSLPDGDICVNGSVLAKTPDKPLDSVTDIFTHWQTALNHPHAKLDEKRKRLIKNALKMGYSDQDLKQAITGCSQTPHNLGDNDRGQRYDGLHIILRDADQIDRFMANAINPPRKLNAQEQLELDNKRIADDYLRSQGLTPVGEENIINHGEL